MGQKDKRKLQPLLLPVILLATTAVGIGKAEEEKRLEFAEVHMGVQVRLVAYAPARDEARAKAAMRAAFDRVAQLDQIASDYRATSELMRLCKYFESPKSPTEPSKYLGPVRVSPDLWTLLDYSQSVAHASRGGFDVSIGPLVHLWRVARKTGVLPSEKELLDAKKRSGWKKIELDARTQSVRLAPRMRLDLGAIAKGYAGDCALQVLGAHGVRRALFEAGGDLVASGPPPNTSGWKVRLPEGRTTLLAYGALSTSGDTAQWVEIGGRRYSHVVDPRTGLGLSQRWMATVRAPRGITADALSTAASVVGPRGVKRLHKHFPQAAIWVRAAPDAKSLSIS